MFNKYLLVAALKCYWLTVWVAVQFVKHIKMYMKQL